MIAKIRESFRNGISRMQWFAAVFAERVQREIAVMRLLSRSQEMEKRKEGLLKGIGARVYDLRTNPDRNVLKDRAVAEAIDAVGELERQLEELKQKASEMGGVGG